MKTLLSKVFLILLCLSISTYAVNASEMNTNNDNFHHISDGGADAQVVLYVFTNLLCGHCAKLSIDTLPKLKKQYTESQLRVVYIDMPYSQLKISVAAHSLLHQTVDDQQAINLSLFLYKNQGKWKTNEDLKKFAVLAGISSANVDLAMHNTKLHNRIVSDAKKYSKQLDISGTPTLFLVPKGSELSKQSKRINGAVEVEVLKDAIDELL